MNKNVYAPPLEAFEVQFYEINDPRAPEINHPFRKNIYPWSVGRSVTNEFQSKLFFFRITVQCMEYIKCMKVNA